MESQPNTLQALCLALDDEYHARATYQAVIEVFGPVQPFANIIESEQRHIEALLRQFARLGATPPPDGWTGRSPAPASFEAACHAAVTAEVENAALYDRLFAMTGDEQVLAVFANLRRASADCHLPAFQRALAGEAAACCGTRQALGRGHGSRCQGGHRHRHGRAQPAAESQAGCGCG